MDDLIALNDFMLQARSEGERRTVDFDGITLEDWVEVVDPRDPNATALIGEAAMLGSLAHAYTRSKSPNMLRRGRVKAIYAHPMNPKQMVYEVLLEGDWKNTGLSRARLRKLNLLEVLAYEVHLAEKEDEERAKTGG